MDGALPVIADTLTNLVAELGTAKDKSQYGRFAKRGRISRYECEALYDGNWIAGKVVDVPAEDMCREWRVWNGSKSVIDALEATERRLGLQDKVKQTLKRAARDGGAAILIGTAEDPTTPFYPKAVGRDGLLYLHAVTRWDLSIGNLDRDPMSPWFAQPTEYRMAMPNGAFITIHPSRVIPFVVTNPGDPMQTGEPWGFSIYERLREPIRDAIAAFQGVASMMLEAKIDVVKVPGLTKGVVSEKFRGAVLQRFGLANTLKSLNNALLLDADEDWDQKTLTFAGFPEILDRLLYNVAGAADMPVTKLVGRSPAGLNSTGDSDLENYYTHVRSRQQTQLRPILAPLDDALIRSALGRVPRGLSYDWRSLWSQSDTDKADVRLKHAQAVKAYADSAIFDHVSLASAAATVNEEDDFLQGLQAAPKAPGDDTGSTGGGGGGAPASDPTQARPTAPARRTRRAPTLGDGNGSGETT